MSDKGKPTGSEGERIAMGAWEVRFKEKAKEKAAMISSKDKLILNEAMRKMKEVPTVYQPNSSMAIWLEARRRCRNHLRLALVEKGMKPNQVAKADIETKVDELMSSDQGEYVRVAFVKLKMEVEDDNE